MIFLYLRRLCCLSPNRPWLHHHHHHHLSHFYGILYFSKDFNIYYLIMLQSMGSQRVGHNWLNWTDWSHYVPNIPTFQIPRASHEYAITVCYWINEWSSYCYIKTTQSLTCFCTFSRICLGLTYFLECHHTWLWVFIYFINESIFFKSLLNLLQYCLCCLCSRFLAVRQVGS